MYEFMNDRSLTNHYRFSKLIDPQISYNLSTRVLLKPKLTEVTTNRDKSSLSTNQNSRLNQLKMIHSMLKRKKRRKAR